MAIPLTFNTRRNLTLNSVYIMRRYLEMPFTEFPQYEAGLIDADGELIKKRSKMSASEKRITSVYDIAIINIKQLMERTKTKRFIKIYAKILVEIQRELFESDEDAIAMLDKVLQKAKLISETDIEEDAAAVSIGGGAVDNTVVKVHPKDQPKFKVRKRNKLTLPR